MKDIDCYLFIKNYEDKISALCVECRNESYPDIGWFYKGTVEGYGPWTFKCTECGKVIHEEN